MPTIDPDLFLDDGFEGPDLALGGFEGPLDLLLHLTQKGRVDIRSISTSQVAEQFLEWVRANGSERLEHVADWLVMAATLIWLKSRLLLPVRDKERRQAEEVVETLAQRLERLEAIRDMVARMGSGMVLGEDWFAPAAEVEGLSIGPRNGATMRRLLAAYARVPRAAPPPPVPIRLPHRYVGIDDAIRQMLKRIEGSDPISFWSLVPPMLHPDDPVYVRSGICAAFVASLELAKRRKVVLDISEDGTLVGVRGVA